MKNIFVILLILITMVYVKETKAQVPDTLAYIQSVVANKAQFIGQPFSVLMDSLKIQIKFFSPFAAIPHDKNKETSTSFSFYFPQDGLEDFFLTYPKLEVIWQTPLNATLCDALWEANNGGGWTSTVAAFYANGIVADIKVRD